MQREKTRTSALKPSDSQSLFKFRLDFHATAEEYSRKNGKPWIWYSFDKPDERDLFPPALDDRLRQQWQQVLQRCFKYPDLYDFLKDCYPAQKPDVAGEYATDLMTSLWMPARVVDRVLMLADKYNDILNDVMTLVGLPTWQPRYSNQVKIPIGFSPRLVTNRDFYGITAFEQNPQIAYWFSTKKLRLVTVYDNRCYHADNKMGIITPDQYPAPTGVIAPPPRLKTHTPGATAAPAADDGRSRQTTVVGSILKNLTGPPVMPATPPF